MIGVAVALLFSGIRPHTDRLTWFLETLPVMIGLPLLWFTRRRLPLTPLLYWLLALHALILIVGGYYSYAEMPLFDWLRDRLHLARNHYDRLGHLAQGFVPALLLRELLLRRTPLTAGRLVQVLVVGLCLGLSAFYELLEWWVALLAEDEAVAFLATQGDPWDTQWDMFLALVGAVTALAGLSRLHDRELRTLDRVA